MRLDEKSVELRRQERDKKYTTLESGIYVKDDLVEFEAKELFDKKMSMKFPKEFVPMPISLARMKYLSEDRPQIIMTSMDTTVNCLFSMLGQKFINENQLEQMSQQSILILKKLNPAMIFFDTCKEKTESGLPICWFSYQSFGIDMELFNIMYYIPLNGELLYGGFNCPYCEMGDWKSIARLMILSIIDLTKKKII